VILLLGVQAMSHGMLDMEPDDLAVEHEECS